ncbi:MAG: ATP-binding cassette domain-containing protein [Lachnospiraceae bacterium]
MNDIMLTSISKYFGEKEVLNNFSARILSGEINCIFAPSGAGKTTLLNILMGFVRSDSGSITGLDSLQKSAVFQEDRLCENLTAITNILLVAPSCSSKIILEAMYAIGLTNCDKQPVSELSGGMKRRVAILRALLSDYDILFLDEPFKGLDMPTKALVIEYVNRCVKGKTVVLVTHDIEEANSMHAKHFLYLN